MSAPQTSHLDVLIRILRYLKRGLLYSDCDHNHIDGFLDTDKAGCPIDKRSTIRYFVCWRESLSQKRKKHAL